MDILTVLRLLKRNKVNVIRIGSDYFARSAGDINSGLNNYSNASIANTALKRDKAQRLAKNLRQQRALVNELLSKSKPSEKIIEDLAALEKAREGILNEKKPAPGSEGGTSG